MMTDPSSPSMITVLGSINIDFSVRAERLPVPGESVVGDDFLRSFGGKGANQAVGIARLTERPVRFVGAVGDDELGQAGISSLIENRINTEFVRVVKGVNTGVALIMLDRHGENSIVAAPGANAFVDPEYVENLPDSIFSSSSLFVICQEIPVESIEVVARRARNLGVPILFNPAPPNPRLRQSNVLDMVDFLTPNETETAAITGLPTSSLAQVENRRRAVKQLQESGAASIALTMGAAGCFVYDSRSMKSTDEATQVPAPAVEAIDTTAAGDSFNAALAVALDEGRDFLDACHWANRVAAISVTRRGAQSSLPRRDELNF